MKPPQVAAQKPRRCRRTSIPAGTRTLPSGPCSQMAEVSRIFADGPRLKPDTGPARGEAEREHPQKVRMSLLQRLATLSASAAWDEENTEPPDRGPCFQVPSPWRPDAALAERNPQPFGLPIQIAATETGNRSMPRRFPHTQGLTVHGPPRTVCRQPAANKGDESFVGYPGRFPAPPGPTEVCYNSTTEKGPGAWVSRGFAFWPRAREAPYQAT